MIEYLSGTIKCKSSNGIILNVNGVGYGVEVPLSTLCDLPKEGNVADLWIYTRVREDAFKLYGFLNQEDRRAFEVLLAINGVGPKVALAIMSTLTVKTLINAAESNRSELLEAVPGIGKAKAEKILVELKSKVAKLFPKNEEVVDLLGQKVKLEKNDDDFTLEQNLLVNDLHLALENLGYKQKDISNVINRIVKESDSSDFGDLMKLILTEISSSRNNSNQAIKKPKSMDNGKLSTLF